MTSSQALECQVPGSRKRRTLRLIDEPVRTPWSPARPSDSKHRASPKFHSVRSARRFLFDPLESNGRADARFDWFDSPWLEAIQGLASGRLTSGCMASSHGQGQGAASIGFAFFGPKMTNRTRVRRNSGFRSFSNGAGAEASVHRVCPSIA